MFCYYIVVVGRTVVIGGVKSKVKGLDRFSTQTTLGQILLGKPWVQSCFTLPNCLMRLVAEFYEYCKNDGFDYMYTFNQ